jgi:hypothetical protein
MLMFQWLAATTLDRAVTYIVTTMRTNGKLITHIVGNPKGITCTLLREPLRHLVHNSANYHTPPAALATAPSYRNQTDIIWM